MIQSFILLYAMYLMLKKNQLWIPFFFVIALSFLPFNFLYFFKITPIATTACLGLGYLFHFFKTKYENSKITFNNKKYFIINADQKFPIGVFVFLKLLPTMPDIIIKANLKMNAANCMNSTFLTSNLKSFIQVMPYINIFAVGYFCSLGIFYMYQSLSLPNKK